MESLRGRYDPKRTGNHKYFVCRMLSAGTRHSLLLMVNINKEEGKAATYKSRKVMLCGLNQLGLCEENGYDKPVDVPWDSAGIVFLTLNCNCS